MKRVLLPLLACLLIVACSNKTEPTAPPAEQDAAILQMERMQLGDDQLLLLDEMYTLGEDLGVLLTDPQLDAFNGALDGLRDGRTGLRDRMDMAAFVYLQLILKANPDLGDDVKAALVQLLRESMQRRERIMNSDLSREEKLRLLRQEHERIIAMMNRLIGEQGVQNVRRLIERLQQERRDREEKFTQLRIERQIEMMTKMLGLDAEQAAKLKRILTAQHDEIMKLRQQFAGDPEGLRDALLRLKVKYDGLIAGILTPEQLRRWKSMQTDRGGKGDISPVKAQVDLMTRLLTLSDQQVVELTRLLTWQQEQMQALRAKYENDPRGLMKAMEELRAMVDRKLAGILTPEQLRRWLAYRDQTRTDRP